jgi:pimeloyl-ACP methyl ester carboxylesterase
MARKSGASEPKPERASAEWLAAAADRTQLRGYTVVLFWLGLALPFAPAAIVTAFVLALHLHLRRNYLHWMVRIFQERPLFIIPRGKPIADAEDVRFFTDDGLQLAGCYLRARTDRRGVILFGLEYGSNRWSCLPYCENLLEDGYDVFAFELRGQGDSDIQPGYDPMQWVTSFEVLDARAAVKYLKGRPDADPAGIGFFGISRGAGAGLEAAALDPYVRCFVTDGVFATYTTFVPYMRHWYRIYQPSSRQGLMPSWYYGMHGLLALHWVEKERKCRFVHLERALRRLAGRPLLMIHGGDDTYIKPETTRMLFEIAREPKELWIVEGAKHNQALQLNTEEYRRRVLGFFNAHLGKKRASAAESPALAGNHSGQGSPWSPPIPQA